MSAAPGDTAQTTARAPPKPEMAWIVCPSADARRGAPPVPRLRLQLSVKIPMNRSRPKDARSIGESQTRARVIGSFTSLTSA